VLQKVAYEHFGDLYAGLKPLNPNMKDGCDPKAESHLETSFDASSLGKQFLDNLKETQVTDTAELQTTEDCTICLFIPYHKFMTIPAHELKKVKKEATLEKLRPDFFNSME